MTKARDLANGGFGLVLMKPSSVVNGTDNGKGTVTFSAATSVSLNNVFNSTYENYRFVLTTTSNSATGYLNMRLRASGSDLTASSYNSSVVQGAYGSTALGNDAGGSNQTTWNRFGYYDGTTDTLSITGDILSPYATAYTSFTNLKARQGYGGEWSTGVYRVNTSVDGITIYPGSGTITGSVSVYGYNK